MSFRQVAAAVCVLLASFVLVAPAAGQETPVTQEQYGDTAEGLGGRNLGDPGTPSASDPSRVGSLPFTGLDLGLMGAAAAALVAGGLVIRRRSAEGDPTA